MDLAAAIKDIAQQITDIEKRVTLIHIEVINKEDMANRKDPVVIGAMQKILELDLVMIQGIRELQKITDELKTKIAWL
ncbi:hypothetical protein KKC83_00500 [Patescibacteria group bacterium]|nr:hypothetical protein [Candidatus Falkowbacteria bacterium]MBU3905450.1 hypothetical protein [Patescibacteria group bacterium]MBU4015319.1 hypothetical protein [Patescibacteria group bacterium]MBU4026017.1 hypothetical protein [Patescibacteria group bacterium]MBU4072994.1 hypothetical protein [Patescibacteria group bacterium]